MKNILKEKIKKMKCLEEIIFLKRYKNDDNIKKILDDYCNQKLIICQEEKKEFNNKKFLHIIEFNREDTGFFALWIWGLIELYYCDKFSLVPYIKWGNKCPYYESKEVNGTNNPFEYYFEQVSSLDLDSAFLELVKVSFYNTRNGTYRLEKNFNELARINKKYMKLNNEVENKIKEDINNLLNNKKTLAVQVRGVEWGNIKNHPIPLSLDKYIHKIDEALAKENFEQIFLATDSDDTIEYLANKYKDKIVYYQDVARASKGSKTLAIFDDNIQRENNHYLLGLEVLRDMMTLAACQGLIAGHSNISTAAIITKLSNGEEFRYKHIFEQQINKNGLDVQKAVKKMKKGNYK